MFIAAGRLIGFKIKRGLQIISGYFVDDSQSTLYYTDDSQTTYLKYED